MFSTALSKILAAKALAVIALVAGATGGVALAANSTGAHEDPPAASAHATADARPSVSPESDRPDDPESSAVAAPDGPGAHPTGTAEPAMTGLCHAWAAGATDKPGKAAENPAFAALVTAAGGTDEVPAYCADLPETTAPGHSGTAAGHSATAPGQSSSAPGQSGTAPGQSGAAPSRSGTAAGHSGAAPGQVGDPSQVERPTAPAAGAPGAGGDKATRPTEDQKPAEQSPGRSGGAQDQDEETPRR